LQKNGDFKAAAVNFRQAADLLLQQASLPQARKAMEMMQTAELQHYFHDASIAQDQSHRTRLKDIPRDSAVVYSMVLPDRIELVMGFKSELKRFSIPVDTAALGRDINKLRTSLEKRTQWTFSEESQKIYNLIVKPMEAELAAHGSKTLVFMPDGVLRTIPFAALHDGSRFLIEKYSVALSPGLELTDSRPIPQKDAKMLSAGLTEAVQGFAPLGNVKEELDGIQGLYKGDRLENSTFNVGGLRESLGSNPYSIVHIATHGKFGPSATETFLLAWDGKIDMNQVGELMKESETRKTPVGMLCLSACETAAGDDKAALGLAGVAVKSGARSAMATLWSVSDQAASQLVLEFYNQLRNSGVSKAEALREAQLKLLDDPQYRHPFYWSPFLMIGNWL
jgi:CHAT domain-containing protein